MAGKGVLDHVDVVAVHGFPLDWNLWQIDEWPEKLDEIRAVTDLPIWVIEVGVSTFGAEEVQDLGPAAHRRTADRPGAAHPLVQPLRPAARLAGDDAPPRGRGLVLLPAFLHGAAARGRHAEAAPPKLSPTTRRSSGICQWFHFEDHRLDDAVAWMKRLGVAICAPGLSWADSFRPNALDWFDRQMEALADFDVTVTFCFTPEHRGHRAAPHQPAAGRARSSPNSAPHDPPLCAGRRRIEAGAAAGGA